MTGSCLKRLAIIGAVLLLAGVLIFCHGALRTSQWMVEASSTDPMQIRNGDGGEEWFALLTSIQREEWFANAITAIGTGVLAGSLLLLAMSVRWQFTLRTVVFATTYLSVLVGIPCGFVRPKLQNPRISVHPTDLTVDLGQIRPYPEPGLVEDPWSSQGWVSRGGSTLVSSISIALALIALIVTPAIAYATAFQSARTKPCADDTR